jgi:hypothetical protein
VGGERIRLMDTSAFVSRLAISLFRHLGLYPFVRPSRTVAFLRAVAECIVVYDLKEVQEAAKPKIPMIELANLFTGVDRALIEVPYTVPRDGNVPYGELLPLCAMVKQTGAKAIFEFGTFDGHTTLLLAMNSDVEARVFTLDLPPQNLHTLAYHADAADPKYFPKATEALRLRYLDTAVAHKITNLYGDSATFDYSPYHKRMDFIFIDGSHSYEYVRSDTQNAFNMLSDQGVIVWHDYSPVWPGVFQFLQELCQQRQLFQIANTSLVVYCPVP